MWIHLKCVKIAISSLLQEAEENHSKCFILNGDDKWINDRNFSHCSKYNGFDSLIKFHHFFALAKISFNSHIIIIVFVERNQSGILELFFFFHISQHSNSFLTLWFILTLWPCIALLPYFHVFGTPGPHICFLNEIWTGDKR